MSYRNRIVEHAEVDPRELAAHPKNWRVHPTSQEDALAGVLSEVGWVDSVLVNRLTGTIIDGHLRVGHAIAQGEVTVPVDYGEFSQEEEDKILATFDPISAMAEMDQAKMADLLAGMQAEDKRLVQFLASLKPDMPKVLGEDTADLTPPVEPVTKLGDLWLLGDHRLLCGDSTKAEDVKRLMAGERASLMATDPPYLVDYVGGQHPSSRSNGGRANKDKDWSGTYREIDVDDADALLGGFVRLALKEALSLNAAIYMWHAAMRQPAAERALRANNVLIHQQIIWKKRRAVLTYSHFMWQHEPCLYGWLAGHQPTRLPPANATSVWEIDQVGNSDGIHPTQKPVRLFADPVQWHVPEGGVCYDPFVGSGTTIVAAEQLDRRCYAMEISPAYCDVSVRRWETLTGRNAVLEREMVTT